MDEENELTADFLNFLSFLPLTVSSSTATTHNDGIGASVSPPSTPATSPSKNKSALTTPTPAAVSGGSSVLSAARSAWAVRPGYSSGASSYSGSDAEDEFGSDLARFDLATANRELNVSTHSDILGLSTLRQEMIADGDLAKTMVRIEVRGWVFVSTVVQLGFGSVPATVFYLMRFLVVFLFFYLCLCDSFGYIDAL